MKKRSILLVLVLFINRLYAQDIDAANLYYCLDKTRILNLCILRNNTVIEDINHLYLLDSSRVIIDTMALQEGAFDKMIPFSANSFLGISLNYSALYKVENNKIELVSGITTYSGSVHLKQEQFSFFDAHKYGDHLGLAIPFGENILSLNFGSNKGKTIKVGYTFINTEKNKVYPIVPPLKKSEKKYKVYSEESMFTSIYFHDAKIYINFPERNICYIFNTVSNKISYFEFPDNKPNNKSSWGYVYDYITKKEFLIKYNKNNEYDIYAFNLNKMQSYYIMTLTNDYPIEIINNTIHIRKKQKKEYCHYLIPLNPVSKNNKLILKDVEVIAN